MSFLVQLSIVIVGVYYARKMWREYKQAKWSEKVLKPGAGMTHKE